MFRRVSARPCLSFVLTALRLFALLLGGVVAGTLPAGAATTVAIHAIQTDLPSSPYLAQTVTTTGIVIAVLSDGFYIETADSGWDSDVCTAEGIYIYTPSGVPSNAVSGNSLTVTGLVEASNNSSYAGTQIYIASPDTTTVVTNSTGNSLPSAVSSATMTSATSGTCSLYSAGTFGQWLPFEGMRVNVPSSSSLLVTQGTGGTVTPASQSATTNGQFWAVFTTTRPFRATGISVLETVPSTAPSTVQRWSGNPQLLLVDTTTLGGTAINATAGTEYTGSSNLIGIIDYHVSTQGYTGLLLTSSTVSALTAGNTVTATAASEPASGQITVATQDLNSLTEAETTRIAKLADAIVNYEHSPDVLAVQGATSAALTLLQSAISGAGGPSYSTLGTVSTADASSLVNAFLVNTAKFDTTAIAQLFNGTTYTTTSSTTATLFDRTPLVLSVSVARAGTTDFNLVLVNSSLLDRTTIDDTSAGANVRLQREKQAETLAAQIQSYQAAGDHVIAVGGYNSFEFSDGYVDTLGILDGLEPTNTSNGTLVTLYDSSYNATGLENTTTDAVNASTGETNTATSRYTYVESGSAEQPDHVLISSDLADLVTIDYARIGADFPVSETYDSSTVNRASSHDGLVAYVTIPYPTTTTITSSLNPSQYLQSVTFTATVASTGGTPTGTVTFYDGSTELGTGTLSSGQATYTTDALTVGSHTIKAVYGGSAQFESSSASLTQVVTTDTTTLTLASSLNPSYYGETVTFTVAASSVGNTPTGTVTLIDETTGTTLSTMTLSSGTASYSTSTLAVGSHLIEATYAGDSTDTSATATVTQVVLTVVSTSSTLSCSPNPAAYGATVTCTDTVTAASGTAGGTVTFYDGTTSLGTATLTDGITTYTTSTLSVGSHTITAVYTRTDPYLGSTSNAVTEVILGTFAMSLTPTARTIYTGEATTYTLTVTPGSGFSLDVALACSGAPTNATCTVAPTTITGGSGTATVTVQTTAPSQTASAKPSGLARGIPVLACGLLLLATRRLRRARRWLVALLAFVALGTGTLITGCGGSGSLSGGTTAGAYTITITGTATSGSVVITETATTSLTVKSMF